MTTRKLPEQWPTFLIKCLWRGTSLTLRLQAKDEEDAWDRAAKKVMRMEGGSRCLEIKVLGTI